MDEIIYNSVKIFPIKTEDQKFLIENSKKQFGKHFIDWVSIKESIYIQLESKFLDEIQNDDNVLQNLIAPYNAKYYYTENTISYLKEDMIVIPPREHESKEESKEQKQKPEIYKIKEWSLNNSIENKKENKSEKNEQQNDKNRISISKVWISIKEKIQNRLRKDLTPSRHLHYVLCNQLEKQFSVYNSDLKSYVTQSKYNLRKSMKNSIKFFTNSFVRIFFLILGICCLIYMHFMHSYKAI